MGKTERDPVLVEIGERISEERSVMGFSQEKLGELSGHSKQTISNAELGSQELRLKSFLGLGEALDTSYDYLLKGERTEIDLQILDKKLLNLTDSQFRFLKQFLISYLQLCEEGKFK